MKILVTGGAGFIASHVAEEFLRAGHEVVILDNLSTGSKDNIPAGARLIEKDIRDPDIGQIFLQEKFDAVDHHAAQINVRASVEGPQFDASVNIIGTLNLLQGCKKAGVKKFIFSSTGGAIYGEQDYFPADEKHPARPVSPYGIGKLAVEKYLFFYRVDSGLSYVALRYGNVYGPRQNPHGEAGVVAIFLNRMLDRKQPVINGDGRQTRDYVFVRDVARANLLALTYPQCGTFNIGTGIETDVARIFTLLSAAVKSSAPEVHGPPAAGEQKRSVLDAALARSVLGWKPSVALEEGMKQTAEWFLKRSREQRA
jgi:UDP-glucose 4-epimerase